MALTLAIPLSGLNIYQFNTIHQALCHSNLVVPERPISPSARSDSSGISSLTTITDITTSSISPMLTDDNNTISVQKRRESHYTFPTMSAPQLRIADFCDMEKFYRQMILPSVSQTPQPIVKLKNRPQKFHYYPPSRPLTMMYGNRDILNFEANLRGSSWQITSPTIPHYNMTHYEENKSIYHRLSVYGLTEDYSMTYCRHCNFGEPLFQDRYRNYV